MLAPQAPKASIKIYGGDKGSLHLVLMRFSRCVKTYWDILINSATSAWSFDYQLCETKTPDLNESSYVATATYKKAICILCDISKFQKQKAEGDNGLFSEFSGDPF